MADRYSVSDNFNLINYSKMLVDYIDSKRVYSAREEVFSCSVCRLVVFNGHHKCIIGVRQYGGYINICIREDMSSSLLNIGVVAAATIAGLVAGKSKGIGKSFLGVAGYKTLENLFYKSKLESIIDEFTLKYLIK